jgi:colanic acid/amylovoran biosynthesis glycosyltransferase
MSRPPVSVVAVRLPNGPRAALERLKLGDADELIVAEVEAGACAFRVANDEADRARHAWLLFLGPACEPEPDLLAGFFSDPVARDSVMLIGDVGGGVSGGAAFNLMVRADVHASVGGFHENVRIGADVDLGFRLRQLGRELEHRPRARANHEGARGSRLRAAFALGAADRWLQRRSRATEQAENRTSVPGGPLVRAAFFAGRLAGRNVRRGAAASADSSPRRSLSLWAAAYPARSETFIYNEVDALTGLGWDVRVQSLARPARSERSVARRDRIAYVEDDPPLVGIMSLLRLLGRHPWRCLSDLRSHGRWARDEPAMALRALAPAATRLTGQDPQHIHVHFLFGAALGAMRVSRILGRDYSVIGHGLDVFGRPANITEKLNAAALPLAPCAYTARFMERLAPDARVPEVVVMGVDAELYRRSRPYPGGNRVITVGRLVEKKGFRHLIDAAALLAPEGELELLTIVGDGPLRGALEAQIQRLGLTDRAEIVDAWGHDEIRSLLEEAAVFAMPVVIAADGDRDAMPVVVKEAMAMELPIVASDEVGLPELVKPDWGRLVAPGDPQALAAALREVLSLSTGDRAAMGALGRKHVIERCSITAEAARLTQLIDAIKQR